MFDNTKRAYIAKSNDAEICFIPRMMNRHGLITGATGTGKTVTLQSLAETFSSMGIPVFAADIKGDLSGVSMSGGGNAKVDERVDKLGLKELGFNYTSSPVCFWDVFGEQGHPIRTTISEMGPLMLSRLLDLNDTQSGVLTLVFKIADENGLLLLDLKDLQKMLEYVGNNRAAFTTAYGNISPASIGAIQRGLLQLETQGADKFFGEPALNIHDFIQTDNGRGVINILAADKLMHSPRLYTTFLLWMLSELYEQLPEVGDMDKPKLVFFFDEAHLLFNDAPKALLDKIEQVVRLIRSKAVGVYFVTQNPLDIPDTVLGQLGNRIQHALRAYTPRDQKAVKTAAQTFRPNPKIDTEKAITELGVGEALVSLLDEKGTPQPVELAAILPPQGKIGAISPDERNQIIRQSLVYGAYEQAVDRESAYEILLKQTQLQQQQKEEVARQKEEAKAVKQAQKEQQAQPDLLGDLLKQIGRSTSRQVSNEIGRTITRGIFGSLFGGGSKRR